MSARVVVVGGGISGLAAAYFLQQSAPELEITVVEKDEQLGGKIQTERVRGCVIEAGPDAMLTQKPWALELCQALGLEDQLISPAPDRKTFVLHGGRMRLLPRGAMGFIPSNFTGFLASALFSLRGKLRMGLEPFVPPRRDDEDESLGGEPEPGGAGEENWIDKTLAVIQPVLGVLSALWPAIRGPVIAALEVLNAPAVGLDPGLRNLLGLVGLITCVNGIGLMIYAAAGPVAALLLGSLMLAGVLGLAYRMLPAEEPQAP